MAYQQRFNIFGQVDEDKERVAAYQEAVKKWPMGKGTCDILMDGIEAMDAEIANLERQKVNSGGAGRVEGRKMDGIARRRAEFQAAFDKNDCREAIAALQQQTDLDMQLGFLEKSKSLVTAGSTTTKFIVLGVLGLVVITAGIIIIKKM